MLADLEIDFVYTWVNSRDVEWRNKKNTELGNLDSVICDDANNENRFLDNDELKYSLRSVFEYAPWVRKIYIVTDNQVPDWFDSSCEKVEFIDHKVIFPSVDDLPSFNSMAIETCLHHIPELSEYFVYFNDDMFLGRNMLKSDFFTEEGIVKSFISKSVSKKLYPSLLDVSKIPSQIDNHHNKSIINSRKLIFNTTGYLSVVNVRHCPKPLLKSILAMLEKKYPDEIKRTRSSKFRENGNVLMDRLHTFYLESLGNIIFNDTYMVSDKIERRLSNFIKNLFYKKKRFSYKYVGFDKGYKSKDLNIMHKTQPHLICLNSTDSTSIDQLKEMMVFLDLFFPNKSPCELWV